MPLIDSGKVPRVALSDGEEIPCIGLGTFGSDKYSPQVVSDAVYGALICGYRLLDCASVYGNEDLIGTVLHKAFSEKVVKRDEVFIASKVWNDMHGKGDVLLSFAKTLKDLQLDYLDAYYLHWPFPNYHEPGCAGDARNPNSVPFSVERFLETWAQLERLQKAGLTRHIGMSNMTVTKLKAVLPRIAVKPALIEMELHPAFQQEALFTYCKERGIQPVGYCPIGSPNRPERDKTPEDVTDTELPEVAAVAKAQGIHPALVCLKWAVQRGQIPIPFSTTPKNYEANLRCVTEAPLTPDEMALLTKAERDCRLVKGQVFLWKGAQGWEDLWD